MDQEIIIVISETSWKLFKPNDNINQKAIGRVHRRIVSSFIFPSQELG